MMQQTEFTIVNVRMTSMSLNEVHVPPSTDESGAAVPGRYDYVVDYQMQPMELRDGRFWDTTGPDLVTLTDRFTFPVTLSGSLSYDEMAYGGSPSGATISEAAKLLLAALYVEAYANPNDPDRQWLGKTVRITVA
jgi:hypothetical protein